MRESDFTQRRKGTQRRREDRSERGAEAQAPPFLVFSASLRPSASLRETRLIIPKRGIAQRASPERIERIAPRYAVPFRPRKKKSRQTKFHRCSWCGAQVRRRSARCKKCSE